MPIENETRTKSISPSVPFDGLSTEAKECLLILWELNQFLYKFEKRLDRILSASQHENTDAIKKAKMLRWKLLK